MVTAPTRRLSVSDRPQSRVRPQPLWLPATRWQQLATLFFLVLIAFPALADSLKATVDRDRVTQGETLTLTLRYGGQALGDPDFSSLDRDFEILSSQRQSQLSFGTGQDSSSTEWRLILLPRKTGTLVIPSFHFRGEVSDAVQIEVSEQTGSASAQQPFFVETDVDIDKPRLHEQVVVTFRVHSAQPLVSLSTEELEVPGARVVRIHETQYQRNVDGRNFGVVELCYALFPERPGALQIPALRFRGEIASADDPFRTFGFSGFGQSRKPIIMASSPFSLDVQPIPDGINASEWLPSKGLSLAQRWSRELDELVVGEPVTRTVIISAQGLQGAQLPGLPLEPHDDFRFYPDQARIEDSHSASGVVGTRIESMAIIPTRPGELVLPAITVTWWDTVAGQKRETVLDAVTVKVAPAPTAAAVGAGTEDALAVTPVTAHPWGATSHLLGLSVAANVILALLAVAFGLLWWRQRGGGPTSSSSALQRDNRQDDEQAAFRQLCNCTTQQPAQLRSAILRWARLRWPGRRLATLDDVLAVSGDPELSALFSRLDASLYSRSNDASFGDQELTQLIARLENLRRRKAVADAPASTLPDLYPS